MLEQVAAANGPPVLVGSSMGGFYGRWLITRVPCAHLFMINPALRPWLDLRDFIGSEQQTAAGERYVLTRERIDQTRAYTPARPCAQLLAPTTLLVDLGDGRRPCLPAPRPGAAADPGGGRRNLTATTAATPHSAPITRPTMRKPAT